MKILQSGRAKAFVFLAIGVVGGSLAAGPLPPAFAKAFAGQSSVQPNVIFTGNSNQPVLKAVNNGTGIAISGQAVSSAGIFGQSTSGGGIVGVSSSGYGLTGTSSTNIGLNGTSSSNFGVGGSTHADYPFAGVLGISLSTDGNAIGVAGEQGANGIGTIGTCTTGSSGSCTGLLGQTLGQNGIALSAVGSNTAPAVGYTPAPVFMIDAVGGGPAMQVQVAAKSAPVLTIDGNGSMVLTAAHGANPLRISSAGTGSDALDVVTGGIAGQAFLGLANGEGGEFNGFASAGGQAALVVNEFLGAPAIVVTDSSNCGCHIMSLDPGGNMILKGLLTTSGSPLIRTQTVTGRSVDSYGPQESEPTIEDFGQGQLVNGQAVVRIDPAFANTMDQRSPYLVFITPDGDSRGLYTTQKTLTGFIVRENGGGRSSVAFDYRIVGKPFGNTSARLPAAQTATRLSPGELADLQRARFAKMHPDLPRAYPAMRLSKRTRPH
ncbi:MAG TPA: hypothetical protein VII69_09595 [Candidatus Eremiobacteraceae bacterium]